MTEKVEQRRMAKVYFKAQDGQLAKNIAAHIRDQNSLCNLVDQQFFQGPEDVEACQLVLIQKSGKNAKLIATCYEKFGSAGVEIVFFDDEGNVVDENEPEKPTVAEPPVVEPVAETEEPGPSIDTGTGGPAGVSEGDSESDPGDDDSAGISVQ